MGKIKFSIFDIFAYLFPGMLGLLAIVLLLNSGIKQPSDVLKLISQLNVWSGIFAVICCYILGFAIDTPGTYLYVLAGKPLFGPTKKFHMGKFSSFEEGKEYDSANTNDVIANIQKSSEAGNNAHLNISTLDMRILAREYSPQNFSYLQLWKMVKTMSHNLSITSLLLMFVSIYKIFSTSSQYMNEWIIITVILLILTILFLHRAYIFDSWHYNELYATVKNLYLIEKAKHNIETDE